jgi:hypothetical protein
MHELKLFNRIIALCFAWDSIGGSGKLPLREAATRTHTDTHALRILSACRNIN